MLLACFAMLFAGTEPVYASTLEDGTYTIDYTIKKPDDESVSMANDYWDKPATLIVSGGAITVQTTINHSEWVTQFKVPSGNSYAATKIISRDEAANTRLTQFTIDSVDKPMLSKIHVTVPEIDYDHDYTIRFVFDMSSLKLISEPEATATPAPTAQAPDTSKETEKAAGSTTAKPSHPTKDSSSTENNGEAEARAKAEGKAEGKAESKAEGKDGANDEAKAGATSSAPAAAIDSKEGATDKDDAQPSNQTINNDTNAANAGSTLAPGQVYKDSTTAYFELSSDGSAEEKQAEEHAETGKEEVMLTPALDGAVAVNAEGVLSASVAPDSSKRNGVIIITFLAVLLVASAITLAIYRKRSSKAG